MSRLTLKPVLDTVLVLAIGTIAVVLVYDRVKPEPQKTAAAPVMTPVMTSPPVPARTVDPEDLAAHARAYRQGLAAYYAWAGQRVGGFGALSRGEIEAAMERLDRPFLYARARMLDRSFDDRGNLTDRTGFAAACAAAAKALEAP